MWALGESVTVTKVVSIVLILAGVIGLNLSGVTPPRAPAWPEPEARLNRLPSRKAPPAVRSKLIDPNGTVAAVLREPFHRTAACRRSLIGPGPGR